QPHDPSPSEHLSSHDAPQQTSASDPEHPAGPAAEEGE
ncbi:NADH-quinone oxidoreductase subunit NuoE, partial [Streptomyces sp. SID7499]|nr:NADH-quinone oxidoreductase subunit NuoE [Streptomyces sp. SID7499]